MNYELNVRKLGNHWYVDLAHLDPIEISLNRKIERTLNQIDKENKGNLTVILRDNYSILFPNTLFINEDDLLEYFTTDKEIEMHFIVRDHEFSISSTLYSLIEANLNPNFHKYLYTIEISDSTI